MSKEIETHPVQSHRCRPDARVPKAVTMVAYEVYCKVNGEQPAMVEGHCRGGFGVGELVAFLYARSFPRDEWRQRFDEAIEGMTGL